MAKVGQNKTYVIEKDSLDGLSCGWACFIFEKLSRSDIF